MNNSRRAPGAQPARSPLQSAAEQALAQAIAQELNELLAPALGKLAQLWCIACMAKVKRLEQAHYAEVAIARAEGRPEPEAPGDQISQAATTGPRGPVCWACYDPEKDGPFDFDDLLPPPVD